MNLKYNAIMQNLTIKLFITLFAAAFLCSCSDEDDVQPLNSYFGQYPANRTHITINGRVFTSPSVSKIYLYDANTPDVLRLKFPYYHNTYLEFSDMEITFKPTLHKDYFTFEYKTTKSTFGSLADIQYKITGTCKSGELNIDVNYEIEAKNGLLKCLIADGMAAEFTLSPVSYSKPTAPLSTYFTIDWKDETYTVEQFHKVAFEYIMDYIKRQMGASIFGIRMNSKGEMKLYSKETNESEPKEFPGEFWWNDACDYKLVADEIGAKAFCKNLFGSDETIEDLYKAKYDNTIYSNIVFILYNYSNGNEIVFDGIPRIDTINAWASGVKSIQFWRDYFEKVGEEEGALAMQKLLDTQLPGTSAVPPFDLKGELVK